MLAGKTVLIVETEIIISLSMQAVLHNLGATNFVVLTNPADFDPARNPWDGVGMAILEIEAGRPDQLHLVRSATTAGTPVLGLTADGQLRRAIPSLPDIPIMVKPVPDDCLAEAVASLMRSHDG